MASGKINSGPRQEAKRADRESAGASKQETGGEEAEGFQQRGGVGEGSGQENLQKKKTKKAAKIPERCRRELDHSYAENKDLAFNIQNRTTVIKMNKIQVLIKVSLNALDRN